MPSHHRKPAIATWSSPPPSFRKNTWCCPGLHGSEPHGIFTETPPESCFSLDRLAARLQDVSTNTIMLAWASGAWGIWIANGGQAFLQRDHRRRSHRAQRGTCPPHFWFVVGTGGTDNRYETYMKLIRRWQTVCSFDLKVRKTSV